MGGIDNRTAFGALKSGFKAIGAVNPLVGAVGGGLVDWGIDRSKITKLARDQNTLNAYNASNAAYGSDVSHQRLLAQGYNKDEALSNARTAVYHGGIKGTIVAYRGTELDAQDILADIELGRGDYSHEAFIQAEELFGKVRNKYGGNVTATGHSLGGTKAIQTANKYGEKAIAFNPGAPAPGGPALQTGSHLVFHKTEDPISANIQGSNIQYSAGGHNLSDYEKDFYSPPVQP